MSIKVLDCTLRDGGYINDWRFGRKTICSILDKLERAGIDIIECGFLTGMVKDRESSLFDSVGAIPGTACQAPEDLHVCGYDCHRGKGTASGAAGTM